MGEYNVLGSCLPMVVPRLLQTMTDAHIKVQSASKNALKQIASVIRNPEVLMLAPTLLKALTEPSKHTETCHVAIMNTEFVHSLDAPSLALIIPVVRRGLRERSSVPSLSLFLSR